MFRVVDLNSKTVSAYEQSIREGEKDTPRDPKKLPTKLLRLVGLYENLCRFVMPLCSSAQDRPNAGTPITQSNNIVDISGVGLKQFWNLKGHMQDASQLATAHYPETLDRIFVLFNLIARPSKPILIETADYRSALFFPHSLGLDQTLVRSHHSQ